MLSCLLPPLLRAAAVFIPSPPRDHKRLPPVFSLRIYFLARTASSPIETRGNLRAQATSRAPWILRSPRLGEQPLGSERSGCILRAHIMQSVAGSHFCCSAWVCMFLCESRGREMGELLVFSDTLTVLVPRCPVKADCVCPYVSLSCSGEGWSDCPAYFCYTWKGSALHPFSNLQRQSSHKGHSLHLVSALGYFPSLPLGNLPSSTSISASSRLKYSGSSELPGVAGQLQAGLGDKLRSDLSHWLGTLSPRPLPPIRIPTGLSFPRPVFPAYSHRDAAGPQQINQPRSSQVHPLPSASPLVSPP